MNFVRRRTSEFFDCQNGTALVYVLVAMPVLIGILGLSLDLQRAFTLNTELQDLADASALAAAAELDGLPGAIARATQAAESVVENTPAAPTDATPAIEIITPPLFFESDCATPATVDASAKCVRVWTQPRTAPGLFVRALGNSEDIQTAAGATARNQQVACQVTPLMMCIPSNPNIFTEGVLFELKSSSQLGPGAFALLDPPGLTSSGNNLTRELLAATEPGFCFVNTASVATGGRTSSIQQGLNIRFDMYPSGSVGEDLKVYPPAPNVTKGKSFSTTGPNCAFSDTSGPGQLISFPLDDCYAAGTCALHGGNRVGNGDWDRDAYWNANHATKGAKPAGYDSMTRYEVYLWELDVSDEYGTPTYANMPTSGLLEDPQPLCNAHKNGAAAGAPSRRIIYIAVADCSGITGNATPNLQSARYGKFFLTRASEGGEILAEFVDWIDPNDDTDILKELIQLIDHPNFDQMTAGQ